MGELYGLIGQSLKRRGANSGEMDRPVDGQTEQARFARHRKLTLLGPADFIHPTHVGGKLTSADIQRLEHKLPDVGTIFGWPG